jgi:ribosomal protein L11 methyltransferase
MGFKVGNRFFIVRSGEQVDEKNCLPIILGPGRAFGSGEHETTWSCLEEMENISIQNSKVLDIGCGTGILSIAAAKMGARYIIALDTSSFAIDALKNNIKLNDIKKKIIPVEGELAVVKETNFNLILANLYGDILLGIADKIYSIANSGGFILLSGILYEYAYDLKTKFLKKKCVLLTNRYLEDYVTMVFKKD